MKSLIKSDPESETWALTEWCSQIEKRGYGEPAIDPALRRTWVPSKAARLIPLPAVTCGAAMLQSECRLKSAIGHAIARSADSADLRAARAAQWALARILNFFVFAVAAVGGGLFLGWVVGFNSGIEAGFDSILRMIGRLTAG